MDFCRTYFQDIEDDKTFVFFTAGRYEFSNKGIDLFIDALNYCNGKLGDEGYVNQFPELRGKKVISFIIAPAPNTGFTQHTLGGSNLLKEMNIVVDNMGDTIRNSLISKICDTVNHDFSKMKLGDLLPKNDLTLLKRF